MERKNMTVEYGVQYRFSPRGMWHDLDARQFVDETEAKKECNFHFGVANDGYHNAYAKHWRVVKRTVTAWEEVE